MLTERIADWAGSRVGGSPAGMFQVTVPTSFTGAGTAVVKVRVDGVPPDGPPFPAHPVRAPAPTRTAVREAEAEKKEGMAKRPFELGRAGGGVALARG
ncbi:hypothetical protein GCM10010468_57460 [Actinocorallia longicatena]|uniref:Uncharacterized protein n=1 Tax=Actinocorallia longicatena TaxID=111803 RepID=A0ABP6QG61_9ACTN